MMKDKLINEALEGYKELKSQVDENPEKARENFLDVLQNDMWSMIGQGFDEEIDEVRRLDLEAEEDIDRFKEMVDNLMDQVKV